MGGPTKLFLQKNYYVARIPNNKILNKLLFKGSLVGSLVLMVHIGYRSGGVITYCMSFR